MSSSEPELHDFPLEESAERSANPLAHNFEDHSNSIQVSLPPDATDLQSYGAEGDNPDTARWQNEQSLNRARWEEEHSQNYENVWSVTEDEEFDRFIVRQLNELNVKGTLLIPGCGSRGIIERWIAEHCDGIQEIICTDFAPSAIDASRKLLSIAIMEAETERLKTALAEKIKYRLADSTDLPLDANSVDAVLVVNSVLSNRDSENQEMIDNFSRVLRPKGYLVGLFPTAFAAAEIKCLRDVKGWSGGNSNESEGDGSDEAGPVDFLKWLDVKTAITECEVVEPKQEQKQQKFYTPLRLRRMIKNANLSLRSMTNYFFDTDYFQKQSKEYYNFDADEDEIVYEHYVVCEKLSI